MVFSFTLKTSDIASFHRIFKYTHHKTEVGQKISEESSN